MKTLSIEKMEQTIGGGYCDQLEFWLSGGGGYQGDGMWLLHCYLKNC